MNSGAKAVLFGNTVVIFHHIITKKINSDVIENIFCQQRGVCNGNNTNPTYYQYLNNINTIILGQQSVSKSANAASSSCEPFIFNVPRPLNPRKRSSSQRKPLSNLTNNLNT